MSTAVSILVESPARRASARRTGFTLTEMIIALTISGLLMAIVASQLVESGALTVRIARALEHSRNARELMDTLSSDIRAAQIMKLYPSFSERATVARDGESGNYLVLQTVSGTGTITRTIGYYMDALPNHGGWALYRHDSARGDNAADALPATSSEGSHRVVKRAVRLPDSNRLFRCVRDRGVSLEGEFGTADAGGSGRPEFVRCTILTRS